MLKKVTLFAILIAILFLPVQLLAHRDGALCKSDNSFNWHIYNPHEDHRKVLLLTSFPTAFPIQTVFYSLSRVSGTSDCDRLSFLRKQEQEFFVVVHWLSLQQEMATGKGERLEAFATLLGCPTDSGFAGHAKSNHARFFSGTPKPAVFVSKVKDSIRRDIKLAASCNLFSSRRVAGRPQPARK